MVEFVCVESVLDLCDLGIDGLVCTFGGAWPCVRGSEELEDEPLAVPASAFAFVGGDMLFDIPGKCEGFDVFAISCAFEGEGPKEVFPEVEPAQKEGAFTQGVGVFVSRVMVCEELEVDVVDFVGEDTKADVGGESLVGGAISRHPDGAPELGVVISIDEVDAFAEGDDAQEPVQRQPKPEGVALGA